MRYSAEHKTETHRRILEAASELFRERGLDAVSVGDVMGKAGLTHGGFYAHFPSKDALIAEALRSRSGSNRGKLGTVGERAEPGKALEAMVGSYLSPSHRSRRAKGCVVAALSGEAGRAAPEAREALAERARGLAQALLPHLPQHADLPPEDLARAVTACLIGGVILSRLEGNAESDRILAACQRFILESVGGNDEQQPHPPAPSPQNGEGGTGDRDGF